MRLMSVAALALSVAAVPAAAQTGRQADAVRALQDPVAQEGIAAAVSALAGIVLDTRVGPLASLTGPESGIRPGDTLRDVQRRRDPQFEARLHDDTRRAVANAGTVAGGALAMSGELARTADRLRAAVAPLTGLLASNTLTAPR